MIKRGDERWGRRVWMRMRKMGGWGREIVYVRKRCNGKSLRCERGNDKLKMSSFFSIPCPECALKLLICQI